MSNLVLELHGPDSLVEATKAMLDPEGPDLAVVRGFMKPDDPLLNDLHLNYYDSDGAGTQEELNSRFPQLVAAGREIVRYWSYRPFSQHIVFNPRPELDFLINRGIEPHFDLVPPLGLDRSGRIWTGPQLSLCLRGVRNVYSERRTGLGIKCEESGGLSALNYIMWRDRANEEMGLDRDDSGENFPKPRSQTQVNAGDLALYPHWPAFAYHSVEQERGALARLITYYASLKQT